jgi:asparagine synthase (glutamine-hydrolysing)
MCGIVGFNGRSEKVLDGMLKSIAHRGPDDFGTYQSNVCSLGHVRLSIVDLSTQGHQPMMHENLKMVYNGEVYNFKEIRDELEQKGYGFESNTDSEVILKAYHCWGIEAVNKFIGMYAITIYDENRSEVVLIRDRVGVKPLYYYHDNEDFIFASELKPIMKYKDDLKISQEGLQEYFQFGYISKNLSIFEDCHKLPAGHYGVYNLNSSEFTIKEYWSILPFFDLPKFQKTEEQLVDELEAILIDAFKYRMVSDVPVGVFLSGGVDSSIVAAILQKHHGDIHTFTIGFSEEKYNEASYAKEVAEHLGTNHTEKILGAKEAKEILKEFVDIYDEPFADSSGIPTTMVCQVARDAGMKVVLSADGGDEVFCGYSRYWKSYEEGKNIFKIPYFLRRLFAFLFSLGKLPLGNNVKPKLAKIKEFLIAKNWQEFYLKKVSFFRTLDLKSLFRGDILSLVYGIQISDKLSAMEQMMLMDYHHYMVDDILTKVDRATMSVSIEGREPLLDHRIAEFMAQVPFEYKYRYGDSKYLLKKVLERYIPKTMIERPKMGFAIPISNWFETDLQSLLKENLKRVDIVEHNLFSHEYVQGLYDNSHEKNLLNTTNKLWFILVFQLWFKKYMTKS